MEPTYNEHEVTSKAISSSTTNMHVQALARIGICKHPISIKIMKGKMREVHLAPKL